MVRLPSAADAAKAAAEQAKAAYDDLLSGQSKYNELQETLDSLTYGTDAWTQALLEANQQVLELLSTYPALAQYIQTGENGRLTFSEDSEEGWKEVIAQQATVARNTQASAICAYQRTTRSQSLRPEIP